MSRKVRFRDVTADLIELTWSEHFAEALEIGGPQVSRRFRLLQLEQRIANERGLVIVGLDRIRADAESQSDTWLEPELVEARLKSYAVGPDSPPGKTYLNVLWFQREGEDAFACLSEIATSITWLDHARWEPFDE